MTDKDPATVEIEGRLNAEYDAWFAKLQALTNAKLNADHYVERWYDGFTPEGALEAGPDDDEF